MINVIEEKFRKKIFLIEKEKKVLILIAEDKPCTLMKNHSHFVVFYF